MQAYRAWSFVGLLLLAPPALGQVNHQNAAVSQKTEKQAAPEQPAALELADLAFWRENKGSDETYRRICAEPKHHDDADLCQQWRTANAALKQAKWAFWQFIASAAGVAGLVVSLLFTAWAALAASRAAKAAQKSADAIPTLERAYIFLKIERNNFEGVVQENVYPKHGHAQVQFKFTNHGKTPAIVKEINYDLHHWTEMNEPSYSLNRVGSDYLVIDGGTSTSLYDVTDPIEVSEPIKEQMRKGRGAIWFFGRVVYDDVFGQEHVTSFWWSYNGLGRQFGMHGGKQWNMRT